MGRLLFFFCFIAVGYGFLLDTNTPRPSGNLMTDDHYDALLKLVMVERTARLQLQEFVTQMQKEISVIPALKLRVEELENSSNTVQSQSLSMLNFKAKYGDLEQKYQSLQQSHTQLQSELMASRNQTIEIKQELDSLKQIKAVDQLQTLTSIEKQMQTVQQDVNALTANNQARGQDFMALYKDVTKNKQTISDLELAVLRNLSKVETRFSQNVTTLQGDIESSFARNFTLLNSDVQNAIQEIREGKEYVGFTAFGTGSSSKSIGTTLTFPNIKSSYGLTRLSTFKTSGIFTCEKTGLYIISITVMSCSPNDSRYTIYINNKEVAPCYIGKSSTSSEDCNSGTGTIVQQLDVNDNILVKTARSFMRVFEMWSSFSVVKLK